MSLLDPEVQSEPWAFYKAMQDQCPVYRIPERRKAVQGNNIHIVDDSLREKGCEHVPTLQRTDPPQHTR